MNILFICKHNKFRSKIAEAYFKKINRNRNPKVASAGAIRHGIPFNKRQFKISGEFGIMLKGKSKGLDSKVLRKQNLIIIVADDVPKSLFNNREYIKKSAKVVQWKIKDNVGGTSDVKIREIVRQIIKKVDSLVKQLGKTK